MRRLLTALVLGSMLAGVSTQTTAQSGAPTLSAERNAAAPAMLAKLVHTPTVLGRGQVPAAATYLADQF